MLLFRLIAAHNRYRILSDGVDFVGEGREDQGQVGEDHQRTYSRTLHQAAQRVGRRLPESGVRQAANT